MKNLRFIDKKEDAQWSVTLNDGRIIALYNEDNKFCLDFGKLIDLEHGVMFDHDEQIPDGWETTTLNDIIAQNLGNGHSAMIQSTLIRTFIQAIFIRKSRRMR